MDKKPMVDSFTSSSNSQGGEAQITTLEVHTVYSKGKRHGKRMDRNVLHLAVQCGVETKGGYGQFYQIMGVETVLCRSHFNCVLNVSSKLGIRTPET